MACFSLTSIQRIFLAECISEHMSGVDTDERMEEAIAPLLEELQASDKPIEITVMVEDTEEDVDRRISAHGYNTGYPKTSDGRSWG